MPWKGQSLTRPAATLSWTACQRKAPVFSSKAISTPLSPTTFGSRLASLLVPTRTTPPATVMLPYVCEPSSAAHLTFFFVFTSHDVGIPFAFETMLRSGVPPHIGHSPVPGSEAEAV